MTQRCRAPYSYCLLVVLAAVVGLPAGAGAREGNVERLSQAYSEQVAPLLERYCLDCHSGEEAEAEVDLAAFETVEDARSQLAAWLKIRHILDERQMPPPDADQPSDEESARLRAWVRDFLAAEARASAGDPGPVVLRRLSNAEYDYVIRDLTGVDSLSPTREFPVDGAAGEGFTNVGSGQGMSPALAQKYLDAAKEVAAHLVLLPDGVRFSEYTTRRDLTDELLARIRAFYRRYTADGGGTAVDLQGIKFETNQGGLLPVGKYLTATLVERDALAAGETTIEEVARERSLSPRYLATLWEALSRAADGPPMTLLDRLRDQWRHAGPDDVAALESMIAEQQARLWKFNPVGQIGREGGPTSWLEPATPVEPKPEPGAEPSPELQPPELATINDGAAEPDDEGWEEFRELFPPALCYARIVPVDEVVTLLLFYREDDQLQRLMLNEQEAAELDRLWDEFYFVSQEPLKLVVAFEQISEFATQDRPDLVTAFAVMREPILARAEAFRERMVASEPAQLEAMLDFADRAWRGALTEADREDLRALYSRLRAEELAHEESLRLTLARILAAPAFLFKLEQPAPGLKAGPVSDVELAARLSFFLWSSLPDEELQLVAEAGRLQETDELRLQTRRMLRDERTRRLAIHFAAQWLHVRDFDQNDDKNEALFPEFAQLRTDMYEETVCFFEDLFRSDGSILDVLAADHAFLNKSLAEYYGVAWPDEGTADALPPAAAVAFRRIDGVRSAGRGGVLGMAAVLASQSGASRTSPILRGNWVYETLLGERLPRPPAGVPQLPETVPEGLTERELIERHSSDAACVKCHAKIDPYGFALERFDAVGRVRAQAVDVRTTLPNGQEIEGLAGLRDYLLGDRREDFVRQFCRKLLGYALGREVQLSDEPLLEEMQRQLAANDYRFRVAVETIVMSDQFRNIRPDGELVE